MILQVALLGLCAWMVQRGELTIGGLTSFQAIFLSMIQDAAVADGLPKCFLCQLFHVDFQIRFRWERNDVAFWDNRCAMHRAIWDYWPNERKGRRVTIKGDRPR